MRWGYALVVAGPALLLALVGLIHPSAGSEDNATLWRNLHVLLLPVFPLLGVAIWILLRGVPGVLAWTARVAAFGYATFYSGLDILTGIGVGALLERQSDAQAIEAVGATGKDLGLVGSVFFIVACIALALTLFKRDGRDTIPGAVVLVLAAVVFGARHINGPAGVLAMLALAAGFAWLAAVSFRAEPTQAVSSAASPSHPTEYA